MLVSIVLDKVSIHNVMGKVSIYTLISFFYYIIKIGQDFKLFCQQNQFFENAEKIFSEFEIAIAQSINVCFLQTSLFFSRKQCYDIKWG